jgi:peptidyl-prolyl cis-trans isomerase SurA
VRPRAFVLAALCGILVSGCASMIPSWMPWVGKPKTGEAPAPNRVVETPTPVPAPVRERVSVKSTNDDAVTDRIVAVVNNDAITLGELQESIVMWRRENQARQPMSDEELFTQFLNRLIDARLQLQEADRERIVVDDSEVNEELLDRVKKLGVPSLEAFQASLKLEGISYDTIRKRVREGLRAARVIRRKVALRVSVTEPEIDAYLEANRAKLETSLSYHARHILIVPENTSEQAWAAAHAKVEMLRDQAISGADFAELARKNSADATAKDGGDLGTLKRGELAKEIEAKILALENGEISQPYRSSLGWHIFRLDTKEMLESQSLARVRQQIRDILFREKYEARLDAWLKEIKQRAIIEVRM